MEILKDKTDFFKKVIKKYGRENQKKKAIEELGELITAIAREDRENIAEEIGDVMIMLFQLMIIYRIPFEKVRRWIEIKLNRLQKRIEEARGKVNE